MRKVAVVLTGACTSAHIPITVRIHSPWQSYFNLGNNSANMPMVRLLWQGHLGVCKWWKVVFHCFAGNKCCAKEWVKGVFWFQVCLWVTTQCCIQHFACELWVGQSSVGTYWWSIFVRELCYVVSVCLYWLVLRLFNDRISSEDVL